MAASTKGIRAGRAFVELFADDSKLVRGLRAAEKKLKAFGDSIRGFGLKMMGLGTAILTPLVAAGRVFASMGSEIADLSVRTGVGVEALSELGYAAEQSGTSLRGLGQTLFRMNRRIANAATGSGPAVRALREMGFSAEELSKLDAAAQFKLMADRLNAMTDPALAAQYAFEVLGDNARDLMPLLRKGSAGMDALAAEARELGLTLQHEDVAAAETLSDAMGRLWKLVKMTTYQIGAALAPTLTRVADILTRVTASINTWIKQNRRWVVQVLKVAAVVVAAGAALVVLGTLISGLGAALGVLASVITGVGVAFSVLASAIGFLVSPIGLVIAALALLGTYLVQTTGIAGQALAWLGNRFHELKDTALQAYQGIADALAAGDIALAAKVLWLTLKMEWTKGVNYIKGLWQDFRGFMIDVLVGAFTGALAALETVWHGLEIAWIETTAFLATAWHGFVNLFLHSWERMKALATKTWNWIKGLFSDSIDVEAANAEIDRALEDRLVEIDQRTGEAVIGTDLRRQTRRDRAASIHEQTLGVIGQGYEDEQNRQARQRAEAEAEAERALIAARREWEEAIAEAKQKRPPPDGGSDPAGLPGVPDFSGIGDMIEREAARIGSVGSFNPAAMLGLALSSDATERTADAAEETARNTKRIERELKTGNLAFT